MNLPPRSECRYLPRRSGKKLDTRNEHIEIHWEPMEEVKKIIVDKKPVLLYKGYTYSKKGKSGATLYCSNRVSKGCYAKVKRNDNGRVISCDKHTHPPPKLFKSSDGNYMKIWVKESKEGINNL